MYFPRGVAGGALCLAQTLGLEEHKSAIYPMNDPMTYNDTTKTVATQKMEIFQRFRVKEPRHSENVSVEKCYLYIVRRSTRQ